MNFKQENIRISAFNSNFKDLIYYFTFFTCYIESFLVKQNRVK